MANQQPRLTINIQQGRANIGSDRAVETLEPFLPTGMIDSNPNSENALSHCPLVLANDPSYLANDPRACAGSAIIISGQSRVVAIKTAVAR